MYKYTVTILLSAPPMGIIFTHILGLSVHPLYDGAPLSQEASWISMYQFAVSNQLTYHATEQLLDLIKIHCPPSNLCAPSLYKIKKQFRRIGDVLNYMYCSVCMDEVPIHHKQCSKSSCRHKRAKLCFFSLLPFEEHVKDIFSGMYRYS